MILFVAFYSAVFNHILNQPKVISLTDSILLGILLFISIIPAMMFKHSSG